MLSDFEWAASSGRSNEKGARIRRGEKRSMWTREILFPWAHAGRAQTRLSSLQTAKHRHTRTERFPLAQSSKSFVAPTHRRAAAKKAASTALLRERSGRTKWMPVNTDKIHHSSVLPLCASEDFSASSWAIVAVLLTFRAIDSVSVRLA